jgi:hypothetical protein
MASVYACGVQSTDNVPMARNLLIGAGAYYLSRWLGLPLAFAFGRLTQGFIYRGDFNTAVVGPLVMHLPWALVAPAAGATVVLLVESERPVRWAILPALLYALLSFLGYHWARPPVTLDRVAQTVGALFPALACLVGAMVAARWRPTLDPTQIKL